MEDQHTITIPEAPGHQFRVTIEHDDNSIPPWERSDLHGPVRHVRAYFGERNFKRAGERVMCYDRGTYWLYDWAAATKMASKDEWDAPPFGAPNRIERAVQADFDHLRGWLHDDWWYVGVIVTLVGDASEEKFSLWGVENGDRSYLDEVASELAEECAYVHGVLLEQRRGNWQRALTEARERRYWAQRDVETA